MNLKLLNLISILALLAGCSPEGLAPNKSKYFDVFNTPVGTVDFPNSCNDKASPLVERGIALLHHMMYTEAEYLFNAALFEDKSCAIALWGKSMTIIHPLWPGGPSEQDLKRGHKLVQQAQKSQNTTAREKLYIDTTYAYFNDTEKASRKDRLSKFEAAWKVVTKEYPKDTEAKAFYALSMIATANKADTSFFKQQQSAEIAKSVLKINTDHPGAHHYIIHAFDLPGLAKNATQYADNYGKMTPKVPHASHMLSHIYTRLGDWEKSIVWNTTSSDTAWEMCVSSGVINSHYTHALDYLAYAHLQMGNDNAVKAILNDLKKLKPPYNKTNHASAYSFSAIPARYAVERQDWDSAIKLSPRTPSNFPWEPLHNPYIAITHFVKALAYSRLGQPEKASNDIAELSTLKIKTASQQRYWSNQIDIQIKIASAWQVFKNGNVQLGLAQMKKAADLEMATQKHPITPGAIIPAYELYGDMLFESGFSKKAIQAYNISLKRNPNRLNSLIGITRAYIALQDTESVKNSFNKIQEQINGISIKRPNFSLIADYLNNST